MDTWLPGHGDAFNVLPVDAEVGALDGDGDSSLHGAETWDNLDGEIQWGGRRSGCLVKERIEMDLNRFIVQ